MSTAWQEVVCGLVLIDNARKFTPAPGAIRVRAGREGGQVWIEVHDSGIGIVPDHQAHVFDKFYQVESGSARAYGGTGVGSCFTIYLPVAPAA